MTWRAWWFLVRLSFLRQARLRQMVWAALGLLIFAVGFVVLNTALDRWNPRSWHVWGRNFPPLGKLLDSMEATTYAMPRPSPIAPADPGIFLATQHILNVIPYPFIIFTQAIVLGLFLGFLLPLWTLSFATEALGGEREQNNLLWLLSRPLDRGAIYLAKFTAMLPWAVSFNLGGFILLCWAGGSPGRTALVLFWPAVFWATLAFAALFHLFAAAFKRPTIVAMVYVFFLEIILNLMPGYLKWATISFYARCMMLEAGQPYGLPQPRADLFVPVSSTTALLVLIGATIGLVLVGTQVFRRAQYQDGTA